MDGDGAAEVDGGRGVAGDDVGEIVSGSVDLEVDGCGVGVVRYFVDEGAVAAAALGGSCDDLRGRLRGRLAE